MQDFSFYSPTEIVFGKNSEQQIGTLSRQLGGKVLVHYGSGSIKRSGLYDVVKASLKDAGVEFVELGGVQPNPRLSLVHEGIALCRKEQVQGILAVGGGSTIDSAKAIAAGVPYEGDVWDFLAQKEVPKTVLPVGVVLTIPAAGSEASNATVVTKEETQEKFGWNCELLRPVFAVLNPERTYTLPPFQTACGVADIMAHVLERYFTNEPNVAFSDRMCEALLRTMVEQAPRALAEPEDYAARAEIMWAGTLAHNDLLGRGRIEDWSSHMIEHELSAIYDVAHGAGLAVVFPAWMKLIYQERLERFVQFAVRVFDVPYTAGEDEKTALEGIRRIKAFFSSIGLPVTMKELGVPDRSSYDLMAEKAVNTQGGKLGSFRVLSIPDVRRIYELAE